MTKLLILIMIIAGIGMIIGFSKQKAGIDWGRPVAVICAIIVLACAIAQVAVRMGAGTGGGTKGLKRELQWTKVSAQYLGQYLAQKYPGSKALVIRDPKTPMSEERTQAILDGLKEGFGGKIEIVAVEEPPIPENAKSMMMGGPEGEEGQMLPPMEYWLTPKIFDDIINKYKDKVDMVITTIGLPQQYARMKLWRMKKRPKVVIAGGSIYELKQLFMGKYIAAAVTFNPDAQFTDKGPSSNLEEAFKERYILVTPETVAQLAQKYGNKLFQ